MKRYKNYSLEEIISRKNIRKSFSTKKISIMTGITLSFPSDERILREILLSQKLANVLNKNKINSKIIFVNDSHECLSARAIKHYPKALFKWVKNNENKPLAIINDPWGCHKNVASHFLDIYLQYIYSLNIDMNPYDSFSNFQQGKYKNVIDIIYKKYKELSDLLSRFDSDHIFKVYCPKDKEIKKIKNSKISKQLIQYHDKYICKLCKNHNCILNYENLLLSWRVYAPVRWIVYKPDIELFSEDHIKRNKIDLFIKIFSIIADNQEESLKPPMILSYNFIANIDKKIRKQMLIKLGVKKTIKLIESNISKKKYFIYDNSPKEYINKKIDKNLIKLNNFILKLKNHFKKEIVYLSEFGSSIDKSYVSSFSDIDLLIIIKPSKEKTLFNILNKIAMIQYEIYSYYSPLSLCIFTKEEVVFNPFFNKETIKTIKDSKLLIGDKKDFVKYLNTKKNNIYGATSDVINYISWFNRQLANPRFALSWKTCLKYSIKNYLFIIKNNPNFSDNKDEINIKLKTQYKQIAKLEDALILMEELYFYITRSLSGNKSLKYEKHIGKITKRMVDFYLCIEQEMQKCISAFHFEKFIELDINWFDDSRK